MRIFDSEINEIQVKPVDVGEECPDITSQRKLGSIRCHITGRTDIMIIGMDTLIQLAIDHSATLTFPIEGQWRWSIQAFSMDQLMPTLNVAAPVAGSPSQVAVRTEPTKSISMLWMVRALALGIGAIAFVFAFQRKSRVAIALTAFCLFVGLGSFVTGPGMGSKVEAQAEAPSELLTDTSISQVELGRQLFVAKGCITCHVNRKISNSSEYWTIDIGATDLSKFSANPEVLFMRLKDPISVKSDTKMPNLELREEEIEALVAFINSK